NIGPKRKKKTRRTATDPENEISVLEAVEENPHVSQKTLARQIGICQESVGRILWGNKFHPYHFILVQELRPTDFPK
ncbi:hypothetical protein BDFB_007253, partial [Asbolus verrucosus]